jgi:predicted PurR-regulated permease PerM
MAFGERSSIPIVILLGIILLFGIVTFALAAATLGTFNKRYDNLNGQIENLNRQIENFDQEIKNLTQKIINLDHYLTMTTTTTTTTTTSPATSTFVPTSTILSDSTN